ncbi:MAG: OmpA family protein [Flavobacteriales bacterium]|nr:OmpA family protein [Flavobacteriales bacterium]
MNRLTLIGFFLAISCQLFGQQKVSILFDHNSYVLTPLDNKNSEAKKIDSLLKTADCESCSVALSAHTDADGTDEYNLTLSKNRLNTVKDYIKGKYPCINLKETEFYGEARLITSSEVPSQKALNRRVEVVLTCEKNETLELTDLAPIYSRLASSKNTSYQINGQNGGTITLPNGAIAVIPPNVFPEGNITIVAQVADGNVGFLLNKLTTQDFSSGEMLQSAGMYRFEAFQNGKAIASSNGNSITVYVKADKADYKQFLAKDKNGLSHWSQEDEGIRLSPSNIFAQSMNDVNYGLSDAFYCRFFWCGFRKEFSPKYRNQLAQQRASIIAATTESFIRNNPKMKLYYDLFKDDLGEKFETPEDFMSFLAQNNADSIENTLKRLIPDFDTEQFTELKVPLYNWINCDRFTGLETTSVEIDEEFDQKKDIRMYFDNIKGVMGATPNTSTSEKTSVFYNVPIGKIVTLVIVKKVGEQLMMSREKFKIGEPPIIKFRNIVESDLLKDF